MHVQVNNISWTSTVNTFPNNVTFFTLRLCLSTFFSSYVQMQIMISLESDSLDVAETIVWSLFDE
jgi:hypothetical protein